MKVWVLKEEGCCDEHEPGYHVVGVYASEALADAAEKEAKAKEEKSTGREDYTNRYSEEYELAAAIGAEQLLEKLAEMRGNKALDSIDERYTKGHRDAIDLLIKWLTGQ